MDIEAELTITRWEFPRIKEILNKPRHMKIVLENFSEACVVL
jgi:hypothetical protein